MLVAGPGRAAAAAARADETEQRMVVRKRRNAPGPSPTGARVNGARRDEASSTPANAREVASLNQAPDGRTRDTKGTARLLDADHCSCHAPIVSQSSHRLNRLVRAGLRAAGPVADLAAAIVAHGRNDAWFDLPVWDQDSSCWNQ